MFVCSFPTDPKFWKISLAFFFFLIFNFAFLKKIVKINLSKCIVTVPKVNCIGTEGTCAYLHVSTRLLDVTYLDTENCMIYIAFFQHLDLKKKKKEEKKKGRPTDPPNFQAKRANKPLFF